MSMTLISRVLHVCQRAGVPVILEGGHGIGKTSLLYQVHGRICAERGQDSGHAAKSTLDGRELARLANVDKNAFGLWACSAANLTIEELIGYPQPQENGTIRYLRSHNFLPPPDHEGGGIWDIDELNLASPEVERALMSVALEGRYLDYVLPPDIFIVTSQNPAVGEYQSRRLNPPMLNRFCQIKVIADAGDVLAYFRDRDFHPAILDCVAEHSDQVLNPHQAKISFDIDQVPTSRSWEYVDRVMNVITPEEIAAIGPIVFTGLLGASAAGVFQKFAMAQGERSIPIAEVLANYGYDPKTYDRDNVTHDAWPMTDIRRRVLKISQRASVRADLINLALQSLADELKGIAKDVRAAAAKRERGALIDAMTEEQKRACVNALAFLCDLPPDQSGPPFMRVIKNECFDYTFKPLAKHKICRDYWLHWKRVGELADKGADENEQEDTAAAA